MAALQLPLSAPTIRSAGTKPGETTPGPLTEDANDRGKTNDGPPVLIISAYFLALASIAVVAVGGQFPWFIVAPATVLSLIAYFRHVEATLDRKYPG